MARPHFDDVAASSGPPPPPPALPVIVQKASGYNVTGNNVSLTLGATPTVGNQLIAIYSNVGGAAGAFYLPPAAPPAGFSVIGSAYGYNAGFSNDSTSILVYQHTVQPGDGTNWLFVSGSGGSNVISCVALYEVTPSGQIILVTLSSPGIGSNPYLISTPNVLSGNSALGCLGLAGLSYLGNLSGGTPPILIGGSTFPTGGWAPDLLVYDTGGTLYGDLQTWTAATTIGAAVQCTIDVQYQAVNTSNPTAAIAMLVLPPVGF